MVIMDPYKVARTVNVHDGFCKGVVSLEVGGPFGVVCADFRGNVLPKKVVE